MGNHVYTAATMDEVMLNDLKQFIAVTISQQTSELRSDMAKMSGDIQEVRGDIKRIDQKFDNLTEHVAEALDTANEATHKQLQNHEKRIRKLESEPA